MGRNRGTHLNTCKSQRNAQHAHTLPAEATPFSSSPCLFFFSTASTQFFLQHALTCPAPPLAPLNDLWEFASLARWAFNSPSPSRNFPPVTLFIRRGYLTAITSESSFRPPTPGHLAHKPDDSFRHDH